MEIFSIIVIILSVEQTIAQVYDIRSQNYGSVPSDIPADTKELYLMGNNISSNIPADAFSHLYQLEILALGANGFLDFPDVSAVGGTLCELRFRMNLFSTMDDSVIDQLVVLKRLILNDCFYVPNIPNVPGPANTLAAINCHNCDLATFPNLSYYRKLKILDLGMNDFTFISATDLAPLDALEKLQLYRIKITVLPDLSAVADTLKHLNIRETDVTAIPPEQLAQLSQLQIFYPGNTTISDIWPICTVNPSVLSIDATNSPALDVCNCSNVWLRTAKEQGASVLVDDKMCGSDMWTASTTQQLINNCQTSSDTNVRQAVAEMKLSDHFCWFPIHTYMTGVFKIESIGLCLSTPGCESFGIRATTNGEVNCVIIAPTDNPVYSVPDSNEPNWTFYTIQQRSVYMIGQY